MEKISVPNCYDQDHFLRYQFTWDSREYTIKSMPYKIIVQETDGAVYCSLDVDNYYDCGAFHNGILFWGERLGRISGYDMASKRICFRSHISPDAETIYNHHAAIYPFAFPPKTNDYDYLPEINLANLLVSQLAISAIAAYRNALIVGDLSGRVSVFDIDTFSLVKTLQVDGAVSRINIVANKLVVDYVENARLPSPAYLTQYEDATRIFLTIDF